MAKTKNKPKTEKPPVIGYIQIMGCQVPAVPVENLDKILKKLKSKD